MMKTGKPKISNLLRHKDKNHILLELWRNGKMSIKDIAEATGLHENDVVAEVETLEKYGRVTQVGTKIEHGGIVPVYQILHQGEEVIRKHIFEIVRYINRDKRTKQNEFIRSKIVNY